MQSITPQHVRSSFINASRSEAAKLSLPKDFDSLDWENLDFLGWRDEKIPAGAGEEVAAGTMDAGDSA